MYHCILFKWDQLGAQYCRVGWLGLITMCLFFSHFKIAAPCMLLWQKFWICTPMEMQYQMVQIPFLWLFRHLWNKFYTISSELKYQKALPLRNPGSPCTLSTFLTVIHCPFCLREVSHLGLSELRYESASARSHNGVILYLYCECLEMSNNGNNEETSILIV